MEKVKALFSEIDVLDKIPMGIFVINYDFELQFWNRTMAGWTGESSKILGRKDIREVFTKLKYPKYLTRINMLFDGGGGGLLFYLPSYTLIYFIFHYPRAVLWSFIPP